MKFEKPYMEISMFDKADLITTSGTEPITADAYADQLISQNKDGKDAAVKLSITF